VITHSTAANSTMSEEVLISDLSEEAMSINYVEVIETVISSLDSENTAMVSHTNGGYVWKFKYGSVEVFAQLTGTTDDDTFSVWSPVLKLPARNEPVLMRKLLEMNWSDTFEGRFAIFNGEVVVHLTRTMAEISPGEISRAITVVATIADDNDELLLTEFGQS
jgi:hypothetical protein